MSVGKRLVVVNADDFGQSPGINRGVIEAFEGGIVTSASLMVRWSAAEEAATYVRAHPELGIGLHIDLGEWWYDGEEWREVYHVVDPNDPDSVSAEVAAQLDTFRTLVGRDPDHLDSHQHVHRREPTRSVAMGIAAWLDIPLRQVSGGVAYCGMFYGQTENGAPHPEAITVEALTTLLRDVPVGTSEIGCHPGYDDGLNTMYRHEREVELATLSAPSVVSAARAHRLTLTTFSAITASPTERGEP